MRDNSNQLWFFWKHCRRLCFPFVWLDDGNLDLQNASTHLQPALVSLSFNCWSVEFANCINCFPTYQDRETHLSLNGTIADHEFAWLLQTRFNLFYSLPSPFQ